MSVLQPKESKTYINVLSSDGTFRMQVSSDTEGAVKREYETSDGTKGTKYEKVFESARGKITDVSIFEGDYGKNLILAVADENGEEVNFSLNTATPFGEDMMKKLPNIDFEHTVVLNPYSFEDENGKTKKGMSVLQNNEKVQSYFHDSDGKATNGLPTPEGDTSTFDSDDWKMYFTKVRKFLIQYVQQNIQPKFVKGQKKNDQIRQENSAEEVTPEDIPFS